MTYVLDESHNAVNQSSGAAFNRTVEEIVIHWWGDPVGQTYDGIVDWFCNPAHGCTTSAHFVASAGQVACIVSPEDIAWHAGDWPENVRSIGIECNPRASNEDYQTVGELVAFLRSQYGDLPLRAHREFTQTTCCGVYDITRIDAIARGARIDTLTTEVKEMLTAAENAAVAKATLNMKIQRYAKDGKTKDGVTSVAAVMGQFNQTLGRVLDKQDAILKEITGLHVALGTDPAAVTKTINDAIDRNFATLSATVELKGK